MLIILYANKQKAPKQWHIKRMATYLDAGIGLDYNPLIGKLKFRGKRVANKQEKDI
jgi:hypothetical protein